MKRDQRSMKKTHSSKIEIGQHQMRNPIKYLVLITFVGVICTRYLKKYNHKFMQVYGSHRSNSFLNLSSSDKIVWQRIKIKILLKNY